MDLKEGFDRALDGGPAHRSIEDRLAVGRRATRRRRTAMGATTLATVLVLGGIGCTVLPSAADDTTGSVATSPTHVPTTATEGPVLPSGRLDPLLSLDLDGELVTLPGVSIVRRDTKIIYRPKMESLAAVVTYKGTTWWTATGVLKQGRQGWANEKPAIEGRAFEQWVHEQVMLNSDSIIYGYGYEAGWVTLSEDGQLTAHEGASIIDQTSPARLDQAPADVPSATALIDVDGARFCVIARSIPDYNGPGIVYLPESEYQGCGDALIGYPYPSAP